MWNEIMCAHTTCGKGKKEEKRGDVFIHNISKETQRKVLRKEDEEKHNTCTQANPKKAAGKPVLCFPPPLFFMTIFLFFSFSFFSSCGPWLGPLFVFFFFYYYYFLHINSPFWLRPTGERKKARAARMSYTCVCVCVAAFPQSC